MRQAFALLILVSASANADMDRFPSGLPRDITRLSGPRLAREAAEKEFLKSEFAGLSDRHFWKKLKTLTDNTHAHSWYQMYVDEIPVLDGVLKTHFSRKGFLQYATSGFTAPVELPPLHDSRRGDLLSQCRESIARKLAGIYGDFDGKIASRLVVFQKKDTSVYACDTVVSWWRRSVFRQFIVDTNTFDILEERRLLRFDDDKSAGVRDVYLSSPLAHSAGNFDSQEITNLNEVDKLVNSLINVKREELVSDTTETLQDVDPRTDYAKDPAFEEDPLLDDGLDCEGSCPNQSFDAVNTYFHLNSFRRQLDVYFSSLGLSASVQAALADPLQVIVNAMSIDLSGEGDPNDEANNAAYIPVTCREGITGGPTFDRCLIFLRPEAITTSACTGSVASITFHHLAREANVIVHEYQHYVTDRLTGMIPGTIAKANVGDALHEGYSDYFGASQVARISGSGTVIGESAFRHCPLILRDLEVIRPYGNDEDEEDPHLSGLSWASGLWALRATMGAGNTDLLALKSLFFLSTTPGFIEAVEALVKADQALNAGTNVGTIRSLFYDQIKFVGGQSGVFRDSANGVVELGLRSCLGTASVAVNPFAWIFVSLFWFTVTLFVGRRW